MKEFVSQYRGLKMDEVGFVLECKALILRFYQKPMMASLQNILLLFLRLIKVGV
jgi:hypothetical protein